MRDELEVFGTLEVEGCRDAGARATSGVSGTVVWLTLGAPFRFSAERSDRGNMTESSMSTRPHRICVAEGVRVAAAAACGLSAAPHSGRR